MASQGSKPSPKPVPRGGNPTQFRNRDDLIRHFEASGKVRTQAYRDTEGIPTIGWGATSYQDGRPVKMGDKVTPQQAEKLYGHHVYQSVQALRKLPNYNTFTQKEREALESFAYNAGPNFLKSKNFQTMSGAIRNGDKAGIQKAFGLYTNNNTPGLVERRKAEKQHFSSKEKANPKDQQGHFNPNSVGKMGPTFQPNSSAGGVVVAPMPVPKPKNSGPAQFLSDSRAKSNFTPRANGPVAPTSNRQVGYLPGLNDIAQAGIANASYFKNKGNRYGSSASNMSNSTVSRINNQSWGSGAPNLGSSLGIRAASSGGYSWGSTAGAANSWKTGFGI